MKQRFLSIVTFLILFSIGFVYLNKVFVSPHNFINSTEDFKELSKKTNIDVLFYGSSHVYTAFNPLIINEKCKTISFNLGSDSQMLHYSDLILEESFNQTTPKLVILEIYQGTMGMLLGNATEAVKAHQLRSLYFVPDYLLNKHKKNVLLYDNRELIDVYSPLIRNHSKWNDKDFTSLNRRQEFNPSRGFYYAGYVGFVNAINNDKNEYKDFNTRSFKRDSSVSYINKEIKNNIIDFVNRAKKSSTNVLVITSPDLRIPFGNYYRFDELQKLCDSLKISYFNLNNYYKELELIENDFRDPAHLNLYGATKTSILLSDFINNNYSLPDRSSEEIWKFNNIETKDFFNRYYSTKKGKLTKELNLKMIDGIKAKCVDILRKEGSYSFTIEFREIAKFKNYNIEIQLYPQEYYLNSLNKENKIKGRKFDKKTIQLNNKSKNIFFDFKTDIKHLKKIMIFLYEPGKRGIVGTPIIIDDIVFTRLAVKR